MAISKKILITLILCFGFEQSTHALSWESFSQAISNSFNNKSWVAPLIGMGLGAIIIGYATYQMFNKTAHTGSLPKQDTQVVAINVLPQKELATCGYHALKNALIALNLHDYNRIDGHNRAIDDAQANESFLSQEYFDAHLTQWKPSVVKGRKKIQLKFQIKESLKPYISPEANIYQDMIDNIGLGKADFLISCITDSCGNQQYTIDKETIVNLMQLGAQSLGMLVTEQDIIAENPQLSKFDRFVIDDKTLTENIQRTFESLDEWLEGDEIRQLLIEETSTNKTEENITIADSIEQIELALQGPSNPIINKWQQTNCIHVFIVGTMNEHNRSSKGHWFTVVAEKRNNVPSIYTMDSLGTNRSNDARVKKIMHLLK